VSESADVTVSVTVRDADASSLRIIRLLLVPGSFWVGQFRKYFFFASVWLSGLSRIGLWSSLSLYSSQKLHTAKVNALLLQSSTVASHNSSAAHQHQ
jgi:hypothetical protein